PRKRWVGHGRTVRQVEVRPSRKQNVSVNLSVLFTSLFEFVARQPSYWLRLSRGPKTQLISKSRHLREPLAIPIGSIFITRLMVAILNVIIGLLFAPRRVMSLKFHSFIDRECGDSHARQAEMIRAIIVPRFRPRVRPDSQPEFFCGGLDHRIEGSP